MARLGADELVAFPAVLGIDEPRAVWRELEERLARPVFEVPTLPPSVPGMRVFGLLRSRLRQAGGRVILNAVVHGAERSGGRVTAVRARIGLRDVDHGCDWFVLATGGFASGGLALDSRWRAREVALGLPVSGVPADERFLPDYFADHPMGSAGVAVDRELRPEGLENVHVAGRDAGRGPAVAGEVGRRHQPRHRVPGGRADPRRARAITTGDGGGLTMAVEHDVLGDLMRGSLDHCVKCTICETFCPVSNVTPLFPGPKYVGPQAERFRVRDEVSADASLDYCSGCGVCTQVCPQGVHIAEINTQARARMRERTGFTLRDQLLARPDVIGRLVDAGRAGGELGAEPWRAARARASGWSGSTAAPRCPPTRAGRSSAGRASTPRRPAARRVAYFHGCGANWSEPRVGEMTVELLEHLGCQVEVPRGQTCCGLPAQSNGMFDLARKYVRRMARRLAPPARAGVDIVGTSTSCTLMLKREAREILGLDADPDLRVVSERVFDICEYLVSLLDRGELRTDFGPLPMTVTYHAPCQQQGHGIGKPALDLMALVPELRVIENDATCCGVAGTYGLKAEKYEIAMDVGARLFAQIGDAHPELAVCDSETCRWHIEKATGVRTVHPIEILHRAAGLGSD